MKKKILLALLICIYANFACCQTFTKNNFRNPPIRYWPRPLWFWNNTTVTPGGITDQMVALRDKCGYGGFGVIPFGKNFSPEYLSEDYLKLYGIMLEKARELNMSMCLYDEYGFPSGSVGAFSNGDNKPRFQLKYPELTMQRLDKTEEDIAGPVRYEKEVPAGKFMGVVAMELPGMKRIDLTPFVQDRRLKWDVPEGKWKIMIFNCVIDGYPLADYLNPNAAEKFTEMVHDVYYEHFREYFGNVIWGTFYDEPSMFYAKFRVWTPLFNEKFIAKYGFDPVIFYPALWYDIGPETRSARSYLFGFRAELFSLGFTKVVNDWSVSHNISATGHTAPEEALIPANGSGDLMHGFKYLEIPGIDKIGGQRPAERFYKLISSAAYNWDKNLVMAETFGAMPDYDKPGDLNWNDIFSITMDQYSKGINMIIPHAVWYDDTKVTYKPELSYRNPLYADSLPAFTRFISRLNVILQSPGRHVADIAILYPVNSLLSEHYFYSETGPANIDGPADPSNAFFMNAIKQIDYVDVANWLTNDAGKDFTFIHPEVLDEKCSIRDGHLHLQNTNNYEDYKVIIVPSCAVISISNLTRLTDFCNHGGTVIFTTRLPGKSLEIGKDDTIKGLIRKIFPGELANEILYESNSSGGKAIFIPHPDGQNLRDMLSKTGIAFDVDYPAIPALQYIHKVVDGRDVYYFANTGRDQIKTDIMLRGKIRLEEWDPHTGGIRMIKTRIINRDHPESVFTRADLNLRPYHSVFWIRKTGRD